jgi:hypothetical protein
LLEASHTSVADSCYHEKIGDLAELMIDSICKELNKQRIIEDKVRGRRRSLLPKTGRQLVKRASQFSPVKTSPWLSPNKQPKKIYKNNPTEAIKLFLKWGP